jgi:hypothetical protein
LSHLQASFDLGVSMYLLGEGPSSRTVGKMSHVLGQGSVLNCKK